MGLTSLVAEARPADHLGVIKVVASLFALGILAAALAACDTHRSSIEAVNNTDRDMLARISVTEFTNTVDRFGYVVIVPAKTRLFIAESTFTGPRLDEIEVLEADCTPLAAFRGIGGGSIAIDDSPRGPSVQLLNESETGAVTAQRTDACPGLLAPLPASTGASSPLSS